MAIITHNSTTLVNVCKTSIVVLVNSLEPANIIVCVRDQVDVQHVGLGGMT